MSVLSSFYSFFVREKKMVGEDPLDSLTPGGQQQKGRQQQEEEDTRTMTTTQG
jgi:hypothetical protein